MLGELALEVGRARGDGGRVVRVDLVWVRARVRVRVRVRVEGLGLGRWRPRRTCRPWLGGGGRATVRVGAGIRVAVRVRAGVGIMA